MSREVRIDGWTWVISRTYMNVVFVGVKYPLILTLDPNFQLITHPSKEIPPQKKGRKDPGFRQ